MIRGQYWLEAAEAISEANKRDMSDPQFWASALTALVNAAMASASDETMAEVRELKRERERTRGAMQKKVQKAIKDDLK